MTSVVVGGGAIVLAVCVVFAVCAEGVSIAPGTTAPRSDRGEQSYCRRLHRRRPNRLQFLQEACLNYFANYGICDVLTCRGGRQQSILGTST